MKKIALYNEKRGVGKTTLSLLLAIALKKKFNIETCLVEVQSQDLFNKRNNEVEKLKKLPIMQEKLKNIVPLYNVNAWQEFEEMTTTLQQDKELVLFDLQGTGDEQITFLLNCDFIFIVSDNLPNTKQFELDRELYLTFQSIKYSEVFLKEIYLIFNKIKDEFDINNIKELNIISPYLGYREMYKEENISTIDFSCKGEIESLTNEINQLVFLNVEPYYQ